VGYKRVNKVTGKGHQRPHRQRCGLRERSVCGAQRGGNPLGAPGVHPDHRHFLLCRCRADSLQNIDTPYYLAPDKRGGKVYALLRETLSKTNKVALARVVLHTRQYLAALMPLESALVLVKLRWPQEVRGLDELELGSEVTKPQLAKGELDMARRLVRT
jgi:DNA end-binding protein Ku